MDTICDIHGNLLATASFRVSDDGMTVVLSRVRNKGALLNYYFAGAERKVLLDTGEIRIGGTLQTRWQGSSRMWLVKMDTAALLPAEPERGEDETPAPAPPVRVS